MDIFEKKNNLGKLGKKCQLWKIAYLINSQYLKNGYLNKCFSDKNGYFRKM